MADPKVSGNFSSCLSDGGAVFSGPDGEYLSDNHLITMDTAFRLNSETTPEGSTVLSSLPDNEAAWRSDNRTARQMNDVFQNLLGGRSKTFVS
ncbi:MAG: hypothetical protein HYW02_07025 [Deltaproteobacteria bacterium]|nr:hypothetical protein [Deltaproteobacteria bacterium]MBI2501195.1 hypothetical protein [Deltaproteobacteria bacterium]